MSKTSQLCIESVPAEIGTARTRARERRVGWQAPGPRLPSRLVTRGGMVGDLEERLPREREAAPSRLGQGREGQCTSCGGREEGRGERKMGREEYRGEKKGGERRR